MNRTGPFFTHKARIAAAEARRRRSALKAETSSEIQVFAVRAGNRFSWEIRRFGGVELAASEETFTSAAKALAAGRAVLKERYPNTTPDQRMASGHWPASPS